MNKVRKVRNDEESSFNSLITFFTLFSFFK